MVTIIGKTCSGKNRIVNDLINNYGFNQIVTYTTRSPRNGEVNGETYHFVNIDDFMQKMKSGFFAEWKAYTTTEGVWYYGTALEDLENADDKSVIILTPAGYRDVKSKLNNENITCIYLYANNATIKKRLIARGDDPKEAERRILHDNEDFKGIENEVDRIVYNNDGNTIKYAVQKILEYVEEVKD